MHSHLTQPTDISVWESAHSRWVADILRDTSADGLHRFYLHCIYSAKFVELARHSLSDEGIYAHPLSDLISGEREPALQAEQAARQRNLVRHVVRACPRVAEYVGGEELASQINRYSSTPFFWSDCGRSLAENFCVYMVLCGDVSEDIVLIDLLRLDGAISGIGNRHTTKSPWTREPTAPRDATQKASEILSFRTQFIDANGTLRHVTDLRASSADQSSQSDGQLIEVSLMVDGKVAVGVLADLKAV